MKKYMLLMVWYIPFIQALTITNKSNLPAVVTQITLPMQDGLEKTAAIRQTHIPIAPQETIDLAKQQRVFKHILGLTLAFNNTDHYFIIKPGSSDEYIIITNKVIETSSGITRSEQELQIPEHETKEARFGPRLV